MSPIEIKQTYPKLLDGKFLIKFIIDSTILIGKYYEMY